MALPGLGLRGALSLSPCQVPPPWGMEALQVGYLVIIPIFQHIWVEYRKCLFCPRSWT